MGYLIVQISVCLLAAAFLGLILGWLLKSLFSGRRERRLITECGNYQDQAHRLNTELAGLHEEMDRLKQKV